MAAAPRAGERCTERVRGHLRAVPTAHHPECGITGSTLTCGATAHHPECGITGSTLTCGMTEDIGRKEGRGTSLVVQWFRIGLAMEATRIQSRVRELRSHMPRGSEARAPQLLSLCDIAREPTGHKQRVRAPVKSHGTQRRYCVPQLGPSVARQGSK